MQDPSFTGALHSPGTLQKWSLLPFRPNTEGLPFTCANCVYVNAAHHNFCTNCSFPTKPLSHHLGQYKFRLFQQQQQLKQYRATISRAQNTLYFIAGICMLGFAFLTSNLQRYQFRGSIMLVLAVLFFALARYTLVRPFTALLFSFLIITSFVAINAWAEMKKLFPSTTGVYLLMVQMVMLYFLFKGMEAAYQLNILEEDRKL